MTSLFFCGVACRFAGLISRLEILLHIVYSIAEFWGKVNVNADKP